MSRKERVTQLIANSKGTWTESHRASLEAMDEGVFQNIVSNGSPDDKELASLTAEDWINGAPEHLKGKLALASAAPPTTNTQILQQPNTLTPEQYIAQAPPAIASLLRNALQTQGNAKAKLVQEIMGFATNRFTADFLGQQEVDTLEGIAQLGRGTQQAQPVANYFGAAGGYAAPQPTINANGIDEDEEVLTLPTMNFAK